jgi:hypothetical protein
MNGGTIGILLGLLVVLTGVALVAVQVYDSRGQEMTEHSFKLIGAEAGETKFQVETSFPGVAVIALGLLLLIVGGFMSRD